MSEALPVVLGLLVGLALALGAMLVAARRRLERLERGDALGAGAVELLQRQVEAVRGEVRGDQDTLRREVGTLNLQLREELGALRGSVAQALQAVSGEVARQLQEGMRLIQAAQTTMGERLDRAAQVVGEVQGSLGRLGEATQRVVEVGRDIQGLEQILRSPKLRGGLGESLLEQVLAQMLPREHYTLQHAFKNGAVVDAVVLIGGRLVPVDAKFPMENFRRLLGEPDEERRRPHRRAFARDVRLRVDEIAERYIRPDEGTFDFALMYVPAENVYYEIIVQAEQGEEPPGTYALGRRVIPVSPNCFYAYLQVIVLGLRGLQIEANARRIQSDLARLGGDLERVREHVSKLGAHLGNAQKQWTEAERDLDRLETKLEALQGTGEQPALPGVPP